MSSRHTFRRAVAARVLIPAVLLFIVTAIIAWSRVGLLDLPKVPSGIALVQAGLADLPALTALDQYVRGEPSAEINPPTLGSETLIRAAAKAREGLATIAAGDAERGLALMREGATDAPGNLVLANAYRIEVFQLRRVHLRDARTRGELTPQFPPHLDREPIVFFEELVREHPSREAKLNLALAWVDEMLLFPALEIKAPASVQAVDLLDELLAGDDAHYVPALFARGLNHLHRPARLVWPESNKTPPDAAAQDIGRCVAIGRRLDAGPKRLHALMAMTLGDAYVKAGRYDLARSWWQIAQNLSSDAAIEAGIRRRYGWRDEEMLDRLEEELDHARAELDHPMTDLALMWTSAPSPAGRGPG